MSKSDAEIRLSIIKGILENASLHRTVDAYKKASDAEKVAYLESTLTALWATTFAK